MPPNDHPLRIGADQADGNHFQGQIGRVTVFRGALAPEAIRELAAGNRARLVQGPQVVECRLSPAAGHILTTHPCDFSGAVSFEAWVQPADAESGRILDKVTPGVDDGFLLDTWPKLSLRMIVGGQQTDFPGVLKPGTWQHVAVVVDGGEARVYLNGTEQ